MNKVLLIDADSTIPNLALMKLAQYYKDVDLVKLNLPYYPNRKKKIHHINATQYDKVFCSVVFDGNIDFVKGQNIIFGGTGVDLKAQLPENIEKLPPNYSIYPNNDTSYGFISRGCIRNCKFCKVPEKEGNIHQVMEANDIVKHNQVKFLDSNFLALSNHNIILKELAEKNIKCCFNQGLDIRLLTMENSELLSKLNYWREYVFALDAVKTIPVVTKKLSLLTWRKPWQLKFFVYVHPDMPIMDTIKRIDFLKENECLPYIMRDISCYKSKLHRFYVDLAAWCNQPGIFKNMDFEEFLTRRHLTKNRDERINFSKNIYYNT